jgi:ribonucleoside-diphosphate reductase alpha chain
MDISVVKRDGSSEKFDLEKIHRVVSWAVEGLSGVTVSEIEMNAKISIVDGLSTDDIHSVLVESATGLISEESPDYQYVAGRLLNYQIRKKVWGGKNPPKLIDLIKKNIKRGHYTPDLLEWYTKEEINKIDEFVNHDQDMEYTFCSVKQLCDKYLIKNQHTRELYETPQFRYIISSMTIFSGYSGAQRLALIKRSYQYFSKFKINLATPQLSGLGTIRNSFASCCLIEMLDDSKSIDAMNLAVAQATRAGYGLGVNFGRMRGINCPTKNGTILHPGVVPFLKVCEHTTKTWQKNGIRGGSATVNFPIWHAEIETIIQLKNATTGTHDNRVFNLDYAIGMSKLFYERFLAKENITLFSPKDVPGLYEAFGTPEFDDLYRQYEKDPTITKSTVAARELLPSLVKERLETGRIYLLNVDNVNQYGSWNEKINMTNLCCEVTQAVDPLIDINDPNSEIGVCILSAINWLEVHSDEEFERICDVVVRMLDALIDIQDYFDIAARNFCQKKRSLGVGITNLAAFLAKNKLKYTDPAACELVDEWMEKQQYYLIKASINMAKEKGRCEKFNTSKYSNGWLPIDKDIKNLPVTRTPSMDWEGLRKELLEHGMRHSTMSCEMPCESSATAQNLTNGVEPVRAIVTYKSSKKSSIPFVVPNVKSHGQYYQLAFDMPDNTGYLNVCNTIQRWMDMGMSVNQYFNPANYEDGKIPYAQILKDLLHFFKTGGKALYYLNTEDGNKHFDKAPVEEVESGCASGACAL